MNWVTSDVGGPSTNLVCLYVTLSHRHAMTYLKALNIYESVPSITFNVIYKILCFQLNNIVVIMLRICAICFIAIFKSELSLMFLWTPQTTHRTYVYAEVVKNRCWPTKFQGAKVDGSGHWTARIAWRSWWSKQHTRKLSSHVVLQHSLCCTDQIFMRCC